MKTPRNFKRLIGKDWDFSYLLELEQYKLKRMANHFSKSRLVDGWEKQVSDCNLAVKLLDIILEKDSSFKNWLHESFKEININTNRYDIQKFPKHINAKNAKRFMSNYVENEHFRVELRRQKAWYLYNRLRYLRMMNWWD